MQFTDSQCSFLSQALVLAADRYVQFSLDAEGMDGGARLAEQFRKQAVEAREMAIIIGDGDVIVTVNPEDAESAHRSAITITSQQVQDNRAARNNPVLATPAEIAECLPEAEGGVQ